MFRKKGEASDVFSRIAGKKNYYWIFGVEKETADEYTPEEYRKKPWVVSFGVSTDKADLDDKDNPKNHLSVKDLQELLTAPYKGQKNPPLFEFELSKNWHTVRVETKEQAEQLASEITYTFRNNNIQPMDDDEQKYPAKIPGTNTVVAFTPPRNGR